MTGNVCFVYWIKRPCDTDIFTQGYVGITKNLKLRFNQHISKSKLKNTNHKLYNYMRKYGDYIMVPILCADEDYCLSIENKLRPTRNIGLNHAIGGINSSESISIALKNSNSRLNFGKQNKGRKLSELTKSKMRDSHLKLDSSKWNNSQADMEIWKNADKYYDYYLKTVELCKETRYSFSTKIFVNLSELPASKIGSLIKAFKNGWNPNNDSDWLNKFKIRK